MIVQPVNVGNDVFMQRTPFWTLSLIVVFVTTGEEFFTMRPCLAFTEEMQESIVTFASR